ncbi:MAG: serine/threonine protein kinase [Planctomycetota bacterium]|nr:serine/threonine protein kinase [Planctomycetota bacterium]
MMEKIPDMSFGKIAVSQGFCTPEQLEDALKTLQKVLELGIPERLGTIMVKKGYLKQEQVKEILKIQGQGSSVKIAGYEILEKVGQGGMGAVYRAKQLSLDRIVALKVLVPSLAQDPAYIERFFREARAASRLVHPNIVYAYDVGQSGPYYYLAMEFVDGETVLEMIKRDGPIPEKRALRIVTQVANALECAYKAGMVHRDIKPDNIMVTRKDEAKLCDLGLAKKTDHGSETGVGLAVGTPHYISPEQAQGRQDVDVRSDIYSLGASLYHMLTGRTLFSGPSAAVVMTYHLSSEAPPPRNIRPEISEAACRLLEKMLAKDPEDRYQTPSDLIADLDCVSRGRMPKMVLPPGRKSSIQRMSRGPGGTERYRPVGEDTATRERDRVRTPSKTAEPVIRDQRVLLIVAGAIAGLATAGVLGYVISGDDTPRKKAVGVKPPDSRPVEVPPKDTYKDIQTKVTTPDTKTPTKPSVVDAPAEVSPGEAIYRKAEELASKSPRDYEQIRRLLWQARVNAGPDIERKTEELWGRLLPDCRREVEEEIARRSAALRELLAREDYLGASRLFSQTPGGFPKRLLVRETASTVEEKRKEAEPLVTSAFRDYAKRRLVPMENSCDLESLKRARAEYQKLAASPFETISSECNGAAARIGETIGTIERVNALMNPGFLAAWDSACKNARERRAGDAVRVCETAMADPNLAAYKADFSRFRRDIQDYMRAWVKARENISRKAGSGEQVMLTRPGTDRPHPCRILGLLPHNEGVRACQEPGGQEFPYRFRDMPLEDVVELSGVAADKDKGIYLLNAMLLLRREEEAFPRALGALRQLAAHPVLGHDAKEYGYLVELEAERFVRQWAREFDEFRAAKDPRQKAAKAESVERLTQRLKSFYQGTVAYRKVSR